MAPDGRTPLTPASPIRFRALVADAHEPAAPRLDPDAALRKPDAASPEPAGFALFFTSYSTWVGHHGIRLEDIYVTPAHRGTGLGKALVARIAQIALDEGCTRLEWDVLTWNEPAIGFYHRLGATTQEDWRIMRVSGGSAPKSG